MAFLSATTLQIVLKFLLGGFGTFLTHLFKSKDARAQQARHDATNVDRGRLAVERDNAIAGQKTQKEMTDALVTAPSDRSDLAKRLRDESGPEPGTDNQSRNESGEGVPIVEGRNQG